MKYTKEKDSWFYQPVSKISADYKKPAEQADTAYRVGDFFAGMLVMACLCFGALAIAQWWLA